MPEIELLDTRICASANRDCNVRTSKMLPIWSRNRVLQQVRFRIEIEKASSNSFHTTNWTVTVVGAWLSKSARQGTSVSSVCTSDVGPTSGSSACSAK